MNPSLDEKRDPERESADLKQASPHCVHVTPADVDDALRWSLKQGTAEPLTPEAALKLRKKIDRHILPLMMICELLLIHFMPSNASPSVLGPVYGQDHVGKQRYSWHSNGHTSGC
jgi:ACS family allantoate permease-like MFS transporter